MHLIDGNICAPQGFLATGIHAGIRKNKDKLDLALIYSQVPASAAGVFTTNSARAACVTLTQNNIQRGTIQAIVVNSGNANACTGHAGMLHAMQMAQTTGEQFHIDPNLVGVASTGVIGVPLPIEKVVAGIKIASSTLLRDSQTAANAIMTTDTFSKSVAIEMNIGEKKICIGGIAKGSGMIHPNMATMLCFLTTDVAINPEVLQQALSKANSLSFNMITVDGETSTNDMCLILANGMAENNKIDSLNSPEGQIFYQGLCDVTQYLAKEIARDGEGATKLIEVKIENAASEVHAQIAARTICRSPLVKSAIFGVDANWGRIVNALGYSGAIFDLNKLTVQFENLTLFTNGAPLEFDEAEASRILNQKTVVIKVNLGIGTECATAWGCDLTYDYVKINGSYRT